MRLSQGGPGLSSLLAAMSVLSVPLTRAVEHQAAFERLHMPVRAPLQTVRADHALGPLSVVVLEAGMGEGYGVLECTRTPVGPLMHSVEDCPVGGSDMHGATRKWSFEHLKVRARLRGQSGTNCAALSPTFTGKKPSVLHPSTTIKTGKRGAKNETLKVMLLHGDLLVIARGRL
ncbi:hypothetical protein DENSPDRAFT_669432, partial [Dentipellis sp. KUC8613]